MSRLSVRWRITLVAAGLFAIALGIASVVLVRTVRDNIVDGIKDSDEQQLAELARQFEDGVPEQVDLPQPPPRGSPIFEVVAGGRRYFIFPDGSAVLRTRQTEAQIGHALTCNEAYDRREISGTLYFEHRTASDVLYLFSLFSPFWLVLLGAVTLAFVTRTGFSRRIRWVALGAALALTAALLLYMPAILLIACATE